ncbi:hypothetical protein DPMN_160764 [Dreissena polymorpha]|uniref:Uncharacterized protein n=1 Tax=Dreissena polymorpha TaxID=45954 RepID=A0A9D4ELE3_DREPO|nr:hypothetical protein DPMN_160764 [Dreissena polymorpha]
MKRKSLPFNSGYSTTESTDGILFGQAVQGLMDTFVQTSTLLFPRLQIQLTKCCLKILHHNVK